MCALKKKLFIASLLSLLLYPVTSHASKAWIWADGRDVPSSSYQYNSSNKTNSMKKLATGKYLVTIPGLRERRGGTVHVSAYGKSKTHCKPQSWRFRNGNREIFVNCYTLSGQPADSRFTLLYLNKPQLNKGDAGYVYANKPQNKEYIPSKTYQWNKSGKLNTIRRQAKGHYVVRFPKANLSEIITAGQTPKTPGGTIMVSAYGRSTSHCQAGDWLVTEETQASDRVTTSKAVDANVYCFDKNGNPIDSRFTALYTTNAALGPFDKQRGAYLWAHGHKINKIYTPNKKYQSDQASALQTGHTAKRLAKGTYEIHLKGVKPSGKSGAFITPYGSTAAYCNILSWTALTTSSGNQNTKLNINCYNTEGQLEDARFTLLYQTNDFTVFTTFKKFQNNRLGQDGFTLLRVFYGTSREDSGETANLKERYTHRRNRSEQISYGTANVSIPHDHQMGELESPYPYFPENPENHVALLQLEALSKDQFLDKIRENLQEYSDEKQALIFIHGFNVTFEDAARRTAQMAYDLDFKGPSLFYSWPSYGNTASYAADEDNIRWAMPHIRDFIKDVIRRTGVDKVHLIAHSMGTRGLTNALREQRNGLSDSDYSKINSIILAAPDIDADVFVRDIVPEIKDKSLVTVYASDNDQALNTSSVLHRSPRTGIIDHLRPYLPEDIDIIDASNVTADFLGHAYYGDNASIITDMRKIIAGTTDKSERCHLTEMDTVNGIYWSFSDGPCS